MTTRINDVIEPKGIMGANASKGYWLYESIFFTKLPLSCVVCDSRGEKRMGEHVLNGLEGLLPRLISSDFDHAALSKAFVEGRVDAKSGDVVPTDTWMFGCELSDFGRFDFGEQAPDAKLPDGVPAFYQGLWDTNRALLLKGLKEHKTLLGYIFWRFGWEVGAIMRLMHDEQISWGTYEDAIGLHCNAHCNNLVLVPESLSEPGAPFLAPLDLDMAFEKKSFNYWKDGKRDSSLFKTWFSIEYTGMENALAGWVGGSTGTFLEAKLTGPIKAVKVALRDTMTLGLRASYNKQKDLLPARKDLSPYCHALLRLALIHTSQKVA
jgi:hypothetical protein